MHFVKNRVKVKYPEEQSKINGIVFPNRPRFMLNLGEKIICRSLLVFLYPEGVY